MPRILLTAFGPYDDWSENASWLAMQSLLRDLHAEADGLESLQLTTRLYPVDFGQLRERLPSDLAEGFDAAVHLGQAPGVGRIELEAFGINVGRERDAGPSDAFPLAADGPAAYRSRLPLEDWAHHLCSQGIPAAVSYHAGEYLCNAVLYLTHYFAEQNGMATDATFLHLPLDTSQVLATTGDRASLPAEESARAVRLLLEDLSARIQYAGEASDTQHGAT